MLSPICLVENVNGSLCICKDAIEFLSRIKEPVVVVSVVGLYRTGKSYLMNRLAGQQSVLGNLVQIYVETISSGKVPCLDNAVVTLANLENQAAVQEALKLYQSGMEKVKNKFPVSVDDSSSEHQKFSSLATAEFMKRSFKDEKGEYLTKLVKEESHIHLGWLEDICYVDLLKENEMASERKCRDLLKNLISDMNKRLQNGEYSQSGGYELYCRDRDAIVEQYRREPNKGVSAEAVLNEFLNERGAEANSILYTDTTERMVHAERERQEDRMRQMEEKFKQELEQQEMDRCNRPSFNTRCRWPHITLGISELHGLHRAIESKLKEWEDLLNKGFREKADLMDEEINNLKKEKEEKSSGGFMKEYVMPIVGAVKDILPAVLQYKMLTKVFKK
ncbi:Guanylate-binding protein 4 [Anabarilius grahami]|uniref:Guanylate-binding protein 4 n=1 Tax=Anabarilius grahami TaxID=495550 RepID=A0A3N0XUR0_ANAGA|nr:Guanylate-binding protein 4 [Anabarilius grahami]